MVHPISPTRTSKPVFLIAFGLFLLVTSGCNDSGLKTYPVRGKFVYEDGSHPMFGDVEFFSEQYQLNARGTINRDGTFTVSTFREGDGAVSGKHKIVVMQNLSSPLLARVRAEIDHDHGKLIALQYNDYRTSGLECEVTAGGNNQFEFVVKMNPKQTADGLPKE